EAKNVRLLTSVARAHAVFMCHGFCSHDRRGVDVVATGGGERVDALWTCDRRASSSPNLRFTRAAHKAHRAWPSRAGCRGGDLFFGGKEDRRGGWWWRARGTLARHRRPACTV